VRRLFPCFFILAVVPLHAYSVLTHEAIIDSAWDRNIKPLLLKRFPNSTPDELIKAHAYAYGGCIIQDMGYYPFGSKLFSDLLHYVRSGDFVVNEIGAAQDLDEYAFALGSLAHYAADNEGHSIAVNPSVGAEYPKLASKFGPSVTYAENPTAHLRVEFGFDVLQVARGNYAPQSYRDFIGFETSKDLLNRAFLATYGIELKDLFTDLDLALGTYRRAVSTVLPEMTRVAWDLNKKELMKAAPRIDRAMFVYNLSRASYEKDWDGRYRKPGAGARVLAFFFRIMPKVGPLKAAKPKPPTPKTTKWFEDSFDKSLALYRKLLTQAGTAQLQLANMNFDTGQPTKPASYKLADEAYAKLAIKLADGSGPADPKMTVDIVAYFQDVELPFATKRDSKEWRKTLEAVAKLKSATAGAASTR
jgi:Zinc dependent phospholipase C